MPSSNRRRTVLKLVGLGLGGGTITGTAVTEEDAQPSYSLVQGDRCVPVAPLSGDQPVQDFYDWAPTSEKLWSSNGTVHLQRPDTSIAFLYDGPEAVSLVFVHGKLDGSGDGGSVSMSIFGLPSEGTWVVEDDNYEGPSNYDVWTHDGTTSEIDWTWNAGRADGGVFKGMTDDATVRVAPSFNEAATLYGEHYDGTVERWEFLSGEFADPRRIELAMDQPITVSGDDCAGDGTSGSDDTPDGNGPDDDTPDGDDDDRKKSKHQRKQEKHQQKHQNKQRKHREKHKQKQRKHREKKEKKRQKKQRKHRKKRKKHERKQEKHGKGNGRGNGKGKGRAKGKDEDDEDDEDD